MYDGRMIFSQLMDYIPRYEFRKCVTRYQGNSRVRTFSCWDQFLCMIFAQLTDRGSLRGIEACLRALPDKRYHMGIRGKISKSTLADANENRDWRIYADFAQVLINEARQLYADEPFGVDLDETVYALDSTTIDLCLSLFPWAQFKKTKGAIKLHTLLDLRGNIPVYIGVSNGLVYDTNVLDELIPELGSIYIMDRGYIDFARLYTLDQLQAVFIIRAKKNMQFRRIYSRDVDRSTGLICDQIIRLTGIKSAEKYPDQLRRIRYRDHETGKVYTFLTNNTILPALTIAELYHCRWQVELFFKWIKMHLRIKSFYGTSLNAVKTQIWIAICVYVLVAIISKRLKVERDLYTILQILSVTLFEKMPILQAVTEVDCSLLENYISNQLELFDL